MKKRLASLDILRGADLFLLLCLGPILECIFPLTGSPDDMGWFAGQFYHHEWSGFVLWDIIMPLFLFMTGITIPFSMAKYKEGAPVDGKFWFKLAKRLVMLFFLGWIVQGNLLNLDWKLFHPFANTLQAIAVGYVATAVIFVFCKPKGQIIVTSLLFLAYVAVFAIWGGWSWEPVKNIALDIDNAILGSHRDGVIWAADGSWSFSPGYRYTWILSSLNFVVTVMLGCFAGEMLRNERHSPAKRAGRVALIGVILIAAALAMSPVMPILKKIWNSSMVLYSGGICFLLLAFTYYVVDVKGHSKGAEWLKYFGMNSITAYCIGEVIDFDSVSGSVLFGFEQYLSAYGYNILLSVAGSAILFFIMKIMYDNKIFLKV